MSNDTLKRVTRFIPLVLILVAFLVPAGMLLAGGMTRISGWYMLQLVPPIAGLVGLIYAIIRAIVRRRIDRTAILTAAAALVALAPLLMLIYPLPFPASLERTTPTAMVRLPANVPLRVAWGGDTRQVNQHVAAPDQRWAYDLVVEPYFNGSATLSDYGCYGIPVVAPVAGLVSSVHDGEPDAVPGQLSANYEAVKGNYVSIRLDDSGAYLILAHLKPGSVAVSAGQRLEEGQVIGQCGNSGNTSEPHIHIHLQRQDPEAYPVNFAEGLPLYFRDHDGQPMPRGGVSIQDGAAVSTGDTVTHMGK